MQSIEIAKRQITYHHDITLTYKIKIIRTVYTNKQSNKKYVRYKIRIPDELQQILQYENRIYFNKIDDVMHISTMENEYTVYDCKIQKSSFNKRIEYSFNLSKKVFEVEGYNYFIWTVKIENNKISDSIVMLE